MYIYFGNVSSCNKACMFGLTCFPENRGWDHDLLSTNMSLTFRCRAGLRGHHLGSDRHFFGTPGLTLDMKMNLSFDIILCYNLFYPYLHSSLAPLPLVRINRVTIGHFKLLFSLPRKKQNEKKKIDCYEGAGLYEISLNPLIKHLHCGHGPRASPSSFSFQTDTSKSDVASRFHITPSRTVPYRTVPYRTVPYRTGSAGSQIGRASCRERVCLYV